MPSTAPPPPPFSHRYSMSSQPPYNHGPNTQPVNGVDQRVDGLKAEAKKRVAALGPLPIKSLTDKAVASYSSALFRLDQRRRDEAFVDYLVAFEIVAQRIPSDKGFPDFRQRQGQAFHAYKQLQDQLRSSQDQFENIKNIIVNESKRDSVQQGNGHVGRPLSQDVAHRLERVPVGREGTVSPTRSVHGTSLSETIRTVGDRSNRTSIDSFASSMPTKPEVRPKPEGLHGHSILRDSGIAMNSSNPDIASRFARLRISTNGIHADTNGTLNHDPPIQPNLPVQMPDPADFHPLSRSSTASSTTRVNGPRQMPGASTSLQSPIDIALASVMPRPPDSIYNPARNMETPTGVNPPRTSARSTIGTGGRVNALAASTASARAPGPNADPNSYFPRINGGPTAAAQKRNGSIGVPIEGRTIEAQVLYDSLELYSVLVIDVRSRQEFDSGHIDARDIICVEPQTTLKPNMSAADLSDRLVLSPDIEHTLFERRDQFDLVVYYDDDAADPTFLDTRRLDSRTAPLATLHDALWDYNADKPLVRQPLLLLGGLEAWKRLLGQASLATSNTVATQASKASKPARRPVPAPLRTSSLNVDKRRRREFNPLDAEEVKKWEGINRQESAVFEQSLVEEPEEYAESEDSVSDAAFIRSQEDFFRRFPSVAEQESMTGLSRTASYGSVSTVHSRNDDLPALHRTQGMPSRPAPAAPRVSYRGAHDRAAAASGTQVSRSSASAKPYGSSRASQATIRLPKTGLINFGVTCYMNATIQCLSASLPLTMYFREGTYRKYIQKDNWKGSKGLLPENYATLLHHLWQGDVQACRPSTFRTFCARLNREWGLERQQDAKEFLEFVMDFLHEDLNVQWRNPPPHVLSDYEEAIRERMWKGFAAQVEWTRYSKRDRSFISEHFAGQHASSLRCRTCGITSTTYEAFFSVSVEIPRSGSSDIYECLRSYCSEEKLSGDEVWRCPKCKVEREANKKITITRAPRNLIVHFKRFRASHQESARKISTVVNFPVSGLDITQFVLPPPTNDHIEATVQATNDPAWRNTPLDPSQQGPFIYDAYAVMRHLGPSLGSGHYIALVKDPGRGVWRCFNDEKVTDFDPSGGSSIGRLQDEKAYIVFYQRREN